MVALGLNMEEQEVIDLGNTVPKNGLVFFPDFCKVVLNKLRQEDEEQLAEFAFKVQ